MTRDIPPVVYFHEQTPEKLSVEVGEYIITGGYPEGDPRRQRLSDGIHEQFVHLLKAIIYELRRKGGPDLPNSWISGFSSTRGRTSQRSASIPARSMRKSARSRPLSTASLARPSSLTRSVSPSLRSDKNQRRRLRLDATGRGAGLPGGNGITLDSCHPRHLDAVAARFADLTIIAARPAWPWQSEMIAVLLHKPNVWCELHGWSPKYFTEELKREIPRRLADRVMFAADYPLFRYERLFADWRDLGYSEQVLERIFCGNAEALLARLGR